MRAAQLDLLLTSLNRNAPKLLKNRTVIWKATSQKHVAAYHQCEDEHPDVAFHRETDFRKQVSRVVGASANHTAFFCDDDIVYRRQTELVQPGNFLNTHSDVLTVSLRLAKKASHCYSMDRPQRVPALQWRQGMYVWDWSTAQYDWGYPGSLDGNVWRSNQLRALMHGGVWDSPNSLEEHLNHTASRSNLHYAGCYKQSLLIGNPTNLVNATHKNRHGTLHPSSVDALNERYLQGKRLRVQDLLIEDVRSAHHEVDLAA